MASSRRGPATASRSCSAPSIGATRSINTVDALAGSRPARPAPAAPTIGISGATQGQGTLHGSPRPDRAGPGVRGEPVVRHRVPVLGLRRRRADRHLQVWPRVGADCRRPPAWQLPAVRSARPTSSSCSRRRASTCSTRRAIPAALRRRIPNASAAECIATGVPADIRRCRLGLDSPAGQYSFLQGGNRTLTPEDSDTYSYGIVFQPRFAPGLAITVDYFDIKIKDTISTFGANNTLDRVLRAKRRGGLQSHRAQPGQRRSCGSARAM